MKILIGLVVLSMACNNAETVTTTGSSDSTMQAIDPKGTIRDTSQYPMDSTRQDSASTGVTH